MHTSCLTLNLLSSVSSDVVDAQQPVIEYRFLSTVSLVNVIMENGKMVQNCENHAPTFSEDAN